MNAGDQYGPYHIIRLIGRGAMGDVYLAHHTQERRPVALKIVHKVNDREVLEAERLGAELQKRLRGVDPRVVPVNTYGEKDGDLTEDERDKVKDDIQEMTKKYEGLAGDMAKKREDEVMEG